MGRYNSQNTEHLIGNIYNSLEVLSSCDSVQQYKAINCRCLLCDSVSFYKQADVLSGKVKRCKQCNISGRIVKAHCAECGNIFEKRSMVESKRFGLVCRACFENRAIVQCKVCEEFIDTTNGNHSGLCAEHWNLHRIAYNLVGSTQYRAKQRGLKFDLDIEWVKQRLHTCEVTGISFELRDMLVKTRQPHNYSNRYPLSPSVDKIDPNGGYTKDNCRVVCWWYNLSKSNWDDITVERIVREWIRNKEFNFG